MVWGDMILSVRDMINTDIMMLTFAKQLSLYRNLPFSTFTSDAGIKAVPSYLSTVID